MAHIIVSRRNSWSAWVWGKEYPQNARVCACPTLHADRAAMMINALRHLQLKEQSLHSMPQYMCMDYIIYCSLHGQKNLHPTSIFGTCLQQIINWKLGTTKALASTERNGYIWLIVQWFEWKEITENNSQRKIKLDKISTTAALVKYFQTIFYSSMSLRNQEIYSDV